MPSQIHFSPRASVEYDNLMDYVIFNFGMRTALEIEEDFNRLLNQISFNPKMYPLFDKRKKLEDVLLVSKLPSITEFRGNILNWLVSEVI